MSEALPSQLLPAIALVIVALGLMVWKFVHAVRVIGVLRHGFDRRAPWIALGILLSGGLLYWMRR